MKTALFTALALLAGAATSAQAATVLADVQFTANNGATQSGAAVVGSAADAWNTLSGNQGSATLTTIDGNPSTIDVSYSANTVWTSDSGYAAFTGTAYANLMSSYLVGYAGDADIAIDLSGLIAGDSYGFYIYTQGDDNSTNRSISFSSNGVALGTSTQTNAGSFAINDNYVYLTATANAQGKIDLLAADLNGEANINGFQIMSAVPESSSLAFMGAGFAAFGMLSLRRRANSR